MSAFKFISFLFPFIKEMVLGDKTLREAVKTNKMRVLMLVLILASFVLNFWLVPRVIKISAYAVSLEHKVEEYKQAQGDAPDKIALPPGPIVTQAQAPPASTPVVASAPVVISDAATADIVAQAVTDVRVKTPTSPPTPTQSHPLPRPRAREGRVVPHDEHYDDWKKAFDTIRAGEADDTDGSSQ